MSSQKEQKFDKQWYRKRGIPHLEDRYDVCSLGAESNFVPNDTLPDLCSCFCLVCEEGGVGVPGVFLIYLYGGKWHAGHSAQGRHFCEARSDT